MESIHCCNNVLILARPGKSWDCQSSWVEEELAGPRSGLALRVLASLEVTAEECMFDRSQSVKTWSQLGLFLVFCFVLFFVLLFPKASTSKGSHFVWVLFWLFLFLTQKH